MSKYSGKVLIALLILAVGIAYWYRSQLMNSPKEDLLPKLAVVTGGNGPYWQLLARGVRAASVDLGVDVQVLEPEHDEDVEGQSKLLSQVPLDEVDGVAVSPLAPDAQSRLLSDLAEKVLVVTVDSDAPNSRRISYVGASNFGAGISCGELVQEAIPEGGKVAVLLANLTKDNMQQRKLGLEEQLATPRANSVGRYDIVAVLEDEGDRQRCYEQIVKLFDDHDDIACLVGLNSRHGEVMVRALKSAGKLGEVKLVAFDTEEATLKGVKEGNIYATIAQDPYQYGYETVQLLTAYSQRDQQNLPPLGLESNVTISTQAVRADDIENFRKKYESRLDGASNRD